MLIEVVKPLNTGYTIVWEVKVLDKKRNTVNTVMVSSYELAKIVGNMQVEVRGLSSPDSRGRVKIYED